MVDLGIAFSIVSISLKWHPPIKQPGAYGGHEWGGCMIRSSETIVPTKKILGNLEIAQKIRTSDVQPWLNFSKWVAWGMAVFTASNPIPPEKYPLTTPYLVLEHIGTVFGGSCGDIRKKIPWQLAMPDPWPRQPPRPLLWWRAIAAAAKRFGVVREDPQFGNPTYRTY